MTPHEVWADIHATPADDALLRGALVKTVVRGLLSDVRHALDNLLEDGHDCACTPGDLEVGAPDTSECVIHNQATHDRLVINRVYDALQRWEVTTR